MTGAEFEWTVDDRPAPMATLVRVGASSRVVFRGRRSGARAYLAVEGGIDVPPVLGSRATHVTTSMGGFDGRALKAGDSLPIGPARSGPAKAGRYSDSDYTRYDYADSEYAGYDVGRPARIRVRPGPHADSFPEESFRLLQAAPYTIDQQSNRMGFRLGGAPVPHPAVDLISDATPMGTVQILPSGLPILLMADRQTTGGYPQLATVIAADFRVAGQLAPGDPVSFALCSEAESMTALVAQERILLAAQRRGVAG